MKLQLTVGRLLEYCSFTRQYFYSDPCVPRAYSVLLEFVESFMILYQDASGSCGFTVALILEVTVFPRLLTFFFFFFYLKLNFKGQ